MVRIGRDDDGGSFGHSAPQKLGITSGQEVLLLVDPLRFDNLSMSVPIHTMPTHRYQVVLLFCPDAATLVDLFDQAKASHTQSGTIWSGLKFVIRSADRR